MEPITAHDRCDRCGAPATAREHEDALTPLLVAYQQQTTDEFQEFAQR